MMIYTLVGGFFLWVSPCYYYADRISFQVSLLVGLAYHFDFSIFFSIG